MIASSARGRWLREQIRHLENQIGAYESSIAQIESTRRLCERLASEISGEVESPGSYVLKGKTHIMELISEAGGFTDEAGRIIKIVRPRALKHSRVLSSHKSRALKRSRVLSSHKSGEENEIIKLDLGKFPADSASNIFYVASGDSIYVSKVSRVFVIGEVVRTGEFTWEDSLTVRQAISLAGGPTKAAALRRTKIIRIKNGKEIEIKVKMDDLISPDDIIKVPGRYF